MSGLTPIRLPSTLQRWWEFALDLLIVAALIYAVPMLVGLGVWLVRLFTSSG